MVNRRKTGLLALTGALTATTAIASAYAVGDGSSAAGDQTADAATPTVNASPSETFLTARDVLRAGRGTDRALPVPAAGPAAEPKPPQRPGSIVSPGKGTARHRETARASRSSRAATRLGRTCGASFYHEPQPTASGERFNPDELTAAHRTLPLGSQVRVTSLTTGVSVLVRINDRGPYVGGRCLDLSRAAFDEIGTLSSGVLQVRYRVL